MTEPLAFEPEQCLIMAVDDVPANLKILQGVLTAAGYRTTFATRGQQVLERLTNVRPDLILLDLMMPEMSGIEVCSRLKQNAETASIPIIFLTASQEIDHLAQAFECGAVDYITKPFNSTELLARVRTHLELSQLRKQAQRQALWETISRKIIQDIHASIHLQDILNSTVQAIQRLLKAHYTLVYRGYQIQAGDLLAIAGDPQVVPIKTASLGHSMPPPNSWAWLGEPNRQGILEEPIPETDPEATEPSIKAQKLHLPLYQYGQMWGGLVVQNHPSAPPWSQAEVETLTLIVQQLEISIQHAELHQRLRAVNQELKRVSNTDGLTQIANRRCFDRQLLREWRRMHREQQPLTLILCDIDYFKQFNDTFGHPRGDACLVAVAQILQGCLKRPADFVARYGGEEFVIILPNTELTGAIELVEQMQREIAALKIDPIAPARVNAITLSFGIFSTVPQQLTAAAAALAQTDAALYQAKKTGRNQYAIAPAPAL
jgi:two-component system, cell cycle response regulator